jgi:hypothetical protein
MAALAFASVLAGCGGGSPDAQPTPTASSPSPIPSPTPSPTSTDQSTPVAAYRAYYAAVIEAGRTANWRSPALPATATGEALRTIVERLRRLATNGQTLRGTVRLNPTAEPVTGDTATVEDCQDSSGWLVYNRDGRPAGTGVPRNDRVVATLVRVGNVWKVSDFPTFDQRGC